MERAALWIIGGPNGAGKTTLASHAHFRRLLRGVQFLNPDQVALEELQTSGRHGSIRAFSIKPSSPGE
jgi:predicted ABC-type ATPase